MEKLKVKLVQLGVLPFKLNFNRIKKTKSSIFEIDNEIGICNLKDTRYSGDVGTYEIDELEEQIDDRHLVPDIDFVLAITNCMLKDDYYARRLANKKVVFTFRNTRHYLETAHIPLENAILRILYEYCMMFDEKKDRIRMINDWFLHHETRSCLFDFDSVLEDVIFSFNKPTICDDCKKNLGRFDISEEDVKKVKDELKGLKKTRFYRIVDLVKKHPGVSMALSPVGMIVINILSSWIYKLICKYIK